MLSQQLSTLRCSQVLLPPLKHRENTFGTLVLVLSRNKSWTCPGSSRARDFSGTSQPSVISTLFGRTPAFPAGILPSSLDWNGSAFATLPGAPGPHAALPQGLFSVHASMQMKTTCCQQRPSPRALCDGESRCLHIVFQPNISFLPCAGITLPDSGEIISLCHQRFPLLLSSACFLPVSGCRTHTGCDFRSVLGVSPFHAEQAGASPPQPLHQACPCACCSSNTRQTTQPLSQRPAFNNSQVRGQGEAGTG